MTQAYLVVLFTRQLQANQDFYERLGIEFEAGQHGSDPYHLSGKLGETVFELYPCESKAQVTQCRLGLMLTAGQHISDKTKQELNDMAEAVHPFENGQTYLVMTDPDGRKVEFLY
jgi:catechol 2,3-dioxygenase-like lactoylglutathione lyase family enzyme